MNRQGSLGIVRQRFAQRPDEKAALGGAAIGGAAGGLVGALVGMGIPEYEAKLYDGKIRGGNALVSVHTEDSDELDRAKDIFEKHAVKDISSSSEASVP